MTSEQKRRWEAIATFEFNPAGAVVCFSDKLQQETGWTRHAADVAIGEYRRFLFLAAAAGHPVSPSPMVDEVWHTHLLYTRNYWKQLCPLLGFELHHEPATGTAHDRAKLDDRYAGTLASYRMLFGEPPPADVWPAKPVVRPLARVDPRANVVVPRGAWRVGIGIVAALLVAMSAAVVLLSR